jgi:large subunit ribosomal protein L17
MRHRKAGFKLGRTTAHRTATLRNLAASLFEHGQIVTTLPRAKAVQPFVEKVITKALAGTLHARRQVIATMGWNRPAFEWLYLPKQATEQEKAHVEQRRERAAKFFDVPSSSEVERNRYGELRASPKLVKHIFDNVAPRFRARNEKLGKGKAGGYTRIVKLGKHRIGDGGELVVLQFVGAESGPEIGGRLSTRKKIANRRAAYAKEALAKAGK